MPSIRTRTRALGALAGLLSLSMLGVPGTSLAADTPIQPGALLTSSTGQCSMNYVFKDQLNKLYVGTAGHCSSTVGQAMNAQTIGKFGNVVFREYAIPLDFTLIKIDDAKYPSVNPAVRSFGGPSGYTTSGETAAGDLLYEYGYGLGFGQTETTRPRYGVLMSDSSAEYVANTGAVNGDSGAPVLHAATGKALGIISRYNFGIPPSTDIGPTVEYILARLAAAGFNVSLVTA